MKVLQTTPRVVLRRHGLGNVIQLLSILNGAATRGDYRTLVTRREWVEPLNGLALGVRIVSSWPNSVFDLDDATRRLTPSAHRRDEFRALLGLGAEVAPLCLPIPENWCAGASNADVLVASEAGHVSREWPSEELERFIRLIDPSRVVLVGTHRGATTVPGVMDLRGRTSLERLFATVARARVVVTMDSAVLHIAQWVGTPTVAIFGSIDPRYRVAPDARTICLQSDIDCCPCNKRETCDGQYDCIRSIQAEDVLRAVNDLTAVSRRVIRLKFNPIVVRTAKVTCHGR